jgi:crossover junction endodeoxyribonuclease RuvC
MTTRVIGIDVGLSGAIAAVGEGGLVGCEDIPTMLKGAGGGKVKNEVNPAALSEILRRYCEGHGGDVLVVIEQVGSMPGQGVASMMSLGDSKGCIRGVVAARGLPIEWVSPVKWKKHYGIGADKELARAKAINLYPAASLVRKADHGRAEAILIARYGWDVLR